MKDKNENAKKLFSDDLQFIVRKEDIADFESKFQELYHTALKKLIVPVQIVESIVNYLNDPYDLIRERNEQKIETISERGEKYFFGQKDYNFFLKEKDMVKMNKKIKMNNTISERFTPPPFKKINTGYSIKKMFEYCLTEYYLKSMSRDKGVVIRFLINEIENYSDRFTKSDNQRLNKNPYKKIVFASFIAYELGVNKIIEPLSNPKLHMAAAYSAKFYFSNKKK